MIVMVDIADGEVRITRDEWKTHLQSDSHEGGAVWNTDVLLVRRDLIMSQKVALFDLYAKLRSHLTFL